MLTNLLNLFSKVSYFKTIFINDWKQKNTVKIIYKSDCISYLAIENNLYLYW